MAVPLHLISRELSETYDTNNIFSEETLHVPFVNAMHDDANAMHDDVTEWDSGIFGCISCDRPWICCMALICPCLLFGEIHKTLKHGSGTDTKATGARCNSAACNFFLLDCHIPLGISLILMYAYGIWTPPIPSFTCCMHNGIHRGIRHKNPQRPIAGTCISDILLTFFCSCCVLVQEHTQLFPR